RLMDRPAWSPDATVMYYGGDALFRRDLTSGQITELYRYPSTGAFVNPNTAVSPDGQQLAVMLINVPAGYRSLALLPTTGGEPRILHSIKQPDWYGGNAFAWTLDSKYILASYTHNNRSQILRISVADAQAQPAG